MRSTAVIFLFIVAILGPSVYAQTPTPAQPPAPAQPGQPGQPGQPPKKKKLNLSPGCVDARKALRSTTYASTMRFVMDAEKSPFEQFSQNLTTALKTVCNPQTRQQTAAAVEGIKKSCTTGDDQIIANRVSTGALFDYDMDCSKAADGNLCMNKFLDASKDATADKFDSLMSYLQGGDSANPEQLPKDLVCSDCFKRFNEQGFASYLQAAPLPPADTPEEIAASKKKYQDRVAKINGICGANFLSQEPQLEMGR